MLESQSSMSNTTKKELKAVKSLRLNKDCMVVLDEFKYKLNTMLDFRVYETLPKNPTIKAERKVQKILSEHKTALPTNLKQKLAP
jgi:hypothetical protein